MTVLIPAINGLSSAAINIELGWLCFALRNLVSRRGSRIAPADAEICQQHTFTVRLGAPLVSHQYFVRLGCF